MTCSFTSYHFDECQLLKNKSTQVFSFNLWKDLTVWSDSTTRLWPALNTYAFTHMHPPCGEREDWEKIDLPLCTVLRGLKPLRMYFLCCRLKRPPTLESFIFGRTKTRCPCLILQTLRALTRCWGKIGQALLLSSDIFIVIENDSNMASLKIHKTPSAV